MLYLLVHVLAILMQDGHYRHGQYIATLVAIYCNRVAKHVQHVVSNNVVRDMLDLRLLRSMFTSFQAVQSQVVPSSDMFVPPSSHFVPKVN